MKYFLIFFFGSFLFTSCYSVKMVAPVNSDVELAELTDQMPVKTQKRVWYALWGLVPISENNTSRMIDDYNFKRVKIESKMTFTDWIISVFTGIVSIVPMTVELEGELRK